MAAGAVTFLALVSCSTMVAIEQIPSEAPSEWVVSRE